LKLGSAKSEKDKGDSEIKEGIGPDKEEVRSDIVGVAYSKIPLQRDAAMDSPHLRYEVVQEPYDHEHSDPLKEGDPASAVVLDKENETVGVENEVDEQYPDDNGDIVPSDLFRLEEYVLIFGERAEDEDYAEYRDRTLQRLQPTGGAVSRGLWWR